jgi:hypothetical protein
MLRVSGSISCFDVWFDITRTRTTGSAVVRLHAHSEARRNIVTVTGKVI